MEFDTTGMNALDCHFETLQATAWKVGLVEMVHV